MGRKRARSPSSSSRSSSSSSTSSSSSSSSDDRRRRRKREKKRAKKEKVAKAKQSKLDKIKLALLEGKRKAAPGERYLTCDDYFAKQAEFMVWLTEKKGMKLEEAGGVEATTLLFCKFAKAWNDKSLPKKYYEGMTSTSLDHTARTQYKWGFASKLDAKTRHELDSARDTTDTNTNQLDWATLTKGDKSDTCSACKGPWPCRSGSCVKGRPER